MSYRGIIYGEFAPLSTTCYFQYLQGYFYYNNCYHYLEGSTIWTRTKSTWISYSTISIYHFIIPYNDGRGNDTEDRNFRNAITASPGVVLNIAVPLTTRWIHNIQSNGSIGSVVSYEKSAIQRPALK